MEEAFFDVRAGKTANAPAQAIETPRRSGSGPGLGDTAAAFLCRDLFDVFYVAALIAARVN